MTQHDNAMRLSGWGKNWISAFSATSLILATALPGVASAEQEVGLEEIIVTAQKRAENVQDVPIAISAVSSQALQNLGLTDVSQLSGHVPNIDIRNTVSFAASSQILVAAIRGIGQNDFAFNLEPGVGVYVDGVYYARSLGAVIDLLDLERIEVLKGPQGTLFGRNTIGGALSVVTRAPGNEFKTQMEITTGRFSRTDVRGSVDLPLIDNTLLSQLSFSSKRRDGYQQRIPFPGTAGTISELGSFRTSGPIGGSDTQGGENSFNVRGKLKWNINSDIQLTFSGDYTRADQEARPATLVKTFAGPTDGTALAAYNGCIFGGAPPFICSNRGTVGTSYFGVNVDADPNNNRLPFSDALLTGDIDKTYARGSNFDDLTAWGLAATLEWQLNHDIQLRSITSYRTLDSHFGTEIAGAPFVANDASFTMDQLQFSQEFQLNLNSFDDRLKSVLGLYYFREAGSLLDTPVFGEGLIQIYGNNEFKNQAYAAFAHETFKVTDQWGLTFGMRYTKEKKEFEGFQKDLNSFFIRARGVDPTVLPLPQPILDILPDPNDPTRLYPTGRNKLDFSNTSIRLGTEYKFTDDMMLYYSFSQGFKSGGWTTRLLDVIPGNNINDLTFRPEKADSHEIGIKSEWLDHRVRLNAAVFSTKYKDMQITVQNGISPVFSNAGRAKIDGAELEAQAKLGDLSLNAGVGYLNARYTSLGANVSTISIDNDLVNTPKWTTSLGAMVDIKLPAHVLTLGADYSYRSETSSDAENSPNLRTSSVGLVNASVGIATPDDVWSLTGGVHNITDKRYIVGGFDQSHPGQVGFIGVSYSPPRQWYLTLRVKH